MYAMERRTGTKAHARKHTMHAYAGTKTRRHMQAGTDAKAHARRRMHADTHRTRAHVYATVTDLREENRATDKAGRTWLIKGPYSNTVRGEHPIVAHDRSEINCNT